MLRLLKRVALGCGLVVLAGAVWLGFVWPPPSWWRTHWPRDTAFMHLRERQLAFARDTLPRRYTPVPLDSISDWLEKAATAAEDDAFFQHHGIDWNATRQAVGYRRDSFDWHNPRDRQELRRALNTASTRQGRLRGASTITQQLAKNLYLSPSRNPLRKIKEAAIALRLEWALPKSRILALYLNVAEFGPNLWGVEAASQHYFSRSAARLSIDQAALLIATLPHPLTSNPAFRPGRTRWRQQFILRRLRGENILVPVEATEDTLPASLRADSAMIRDSLRADSLLPDSIGRDSLEPDTVVPDSLKPRSIKPSPTDTAAVPPKDTTAAPRSVPRP
jgi:monofunctional glycosyltransferase